MQGNFLSYTILTNTNTSRRGSYFTCNIYFINLLNSFVELAPVSTGLFAKTYKSIKLKPLKFYPHTFKTRNLAILFLPNQLLRLRVRPISQIFQFAYFGRKTFLHRDDGSHFSPPEILSSSRETAATSTGRESEPSLKDYSQIE